VAEVDHQLHRCIVGRNWSDDGAASIAEHSLERYARPREIQPQILLYKENSLTEHDLGARVLVSLVASSVLASLSSSIGSRLGIEGMLAEAVNQVVSFAVIFTMFAALMRYMPDARVAWRDVWVGALVTAVLFTIGRATMQVYLSTSNPAAQLGSAAASLAVILVWVYYSSMIFLFGAEFTRSWAESNGRLVRSEPHAVRVVETIERS
jgi:membrane protein